METKQNTLSFFIGAGVLALVILGVFFFFSKGNTENNNSVYEGDGFSLGVTGDATITEEIQQTVPAPSYKTSLMFKRDVTPEEKELLQTRYIQIQEFLDGQPLSFDAWINLGIIRKAAGDYEGALEAWTYITKIYPQSTVAFDSIGDLHLNFIPDFPKAEANFKASLAVNPSNINAYQQLFSLYTLYGYKSGTSAAADIVAEGLKNNPNNQTLLQMQAQLAAQ